MIDPLKIVQSVNLTTEMMVGGKRYSFTLQPTDHAIGVDIGDLCAELDQRIGEPIERAVGRYLDKTITRHIRENVVRELAEKIITYDRVVKESKG